jgi:hypothetical protein
MAAKSGDPLVERPAAKSNVLPAERLIEKSSEAIADQRSALRRKWSSNDKRGGMTHGAFYLLYKKIKKTTKTCKGSFLGDSQLE